MRLILLGPPGSGKGTQAKLLAQRKDLAHISTGDILREAVRLGTPAGLQAKSFVTTGRLVPDSLVNDIIHERFRADDRPERFVMDGYPRTVPQAAAFDQVLRQQFLNQDAVVSLVVDDDEIVQRMSGRWVCPNNECKASYHTRFNPPRAVGVCDECGSTLIQRDDDRADTVRRRLEIYHQNNVDLLAHYRNQGLLREVAGSGDIETIHGNMIKVLPARAGC